MKPNVGLTLFTSSFMIFFTMVVFPALSRPLPQSIFSDAIAASRTYSIKMRISLSFNRAFRNIDNILVLLVQTTPFCRLSDTQRNYKSRVELPSAKIASTTPTCCSPPNAPSNSRFSTDVV